MGNIERDLKRADWPLRLFEHAGGREWSTNDHGDLWKHAESVEVVPASQPAGAVEVFEAACAWADSPQPVTDGSAGRLHDAIDKARGDSSGGQ